MTHNDEFDQVLDDALAEYREAEPLAGLEDRVLQRLRLQTERRRKLWWRWSAITAVAAALAVAAWIGLRDHARPEVMPSSAAQKREPPIEHPPGTVEAAYEQPTSKRSPWSNAVSERTPLSTQAQFSIAEHAPMHEQFPSPAPLGPEERMLLALATTHPEILKAKSEEDTEIVIAPINIRPLGDENGGYQGEN